MSTPRAQSAGRYTGHRPARRPRPVSISGRKTTTGSPRLSSRSTSAWTSRPSGAKSKAIQPPLNERGRRLRAGAEAKSLGLGGNVLVWRATGIGLTTIWRGLKELEAGRVRQSGGGRKPMAEVDETLLYDLLSLVDPATSGNPESALRWSLYHGWGRS